MRNLQWPIVLWGGLLLFSQNIGAQTTLATSPPAMLPSAGADRVVNPALYLSLQWRNIGPFRGGRCVTVCGVPAEPLVYYMGAAGGGVWKTEDAGISWRNISDGYFKSGAVGAIAVAPSDPSIVYAGTGEHAVRGTMTSSGDGLYKSYDSGKTWAYAGLPASQHISAIRIHPGNPDLIYVAVQGALYGSNEERGVFKSTDGGATWRKVLYVNANTGASDLSIDPRNPRILYAAMWDHQRYPWKIRSGGGGSGLYKSTDGGESWIKLTQGLPKEMGKAGIAVSKADPNVVYAIIEAERGGVFRSVNGGDSWVQTNNQRLTIARAWYYAKIVPDPHDPETVYALNAPLLRSIDGGKTFEEIPNPHPDQHDLWINPDNPRLMILANDGGACVSQNGGLSWSTTYNQPTGQFYRVNADNRFPYYIYGAQQDYTTVAIPSRTSNTGISNSDWYEVGGCESGFIAFNPNDPRQVYSSCYQGYITAYDAGLRRERDIMAYPAIGMATPPREMKYRFNWNAPVVVSPHHPETIYHGANVILRTQDGGMNWQAISPDLTRNEPARQEAGGGPFTNEGAGGENYNTISYIACSPLEEGLIWVGSDDGLVHLTRDEGKSWQQISPPGLGEALINSIEVSPHRNGAAYIVATRYKWSDNRPLIYYTPDYGQTWQLIVSGISAGDFARVVREDPMQPGLLFAGTENGLYLSFNNGLFWQRFQLNLPNCPVTDLLIHDNDLVAATAGRAFWVLDDISPLQQSKGVLFNGHVQLFRPKNAYRFDAAQTELPIQGLGQNPPNGVIIDYYLPSAMDTVALSLQILDRHGKLVRQYSNQLNTDYERYEGGPPPVQVMPAKKGLNRFNWDLRREQMPYTPGVFLADNYRGSQVGPGVYTIRLITPKDTFVQTCTVLADPNVQATPADYEAQQQLLQTLSLQAREIIGSIASMREVKKQLELSVDILSKMEGSQDLVSSGRNMLARINNWESQLIQPRQQTYLDVINYPGRLYAELIYLIKIADTHTPAVTQGVRARAQDLVTTWEKQKTDMQDILDNDLQAYNNLYKAKGLPAILISGGTGLR